MFVLFQRYHYRSDVFTADDSSDEDSLHLPSTTWKIEEEEEEQRILGIAKNVLGKKQELPDTAALPSKAKKASKNKQVRCFRTLLTHLLQK